MHLLSVAIPKYLLFFFFFFFFFFYLDTLSHSEIFVVDFLAFVVIPETVAFLVLVASSTVRLGQNNLLVQSQSSKSFLVVK